jgi:nucleoside-diphosphate kinase
MPIERTFAMLKPGAHQRRIIGEVLSRLENGGFNIIAMKQLTVTPELAERHYGEHKGKDFYDPLVEYMTSGPSIAMVLERENAIAALRKMCGATNPDDADPGTIRGDYGVITRRNIVHASDSVESARREIGLFFRDDEIYSFEDSNAKWI